MPEYTSRFGTHRAGGVGFLLQDGPPQHVMGVQLDNPFRLQLKAGVRCPHRLQLDKAVDAYPEEFLDLVRDPLVVELLPLPKRGRSPVFVSVSPPEETAVLDWIEVLDRLSAPVEPEGGRPIWSVTDTRIATELTATNLSPVVITGVRPEHTKRVFQLGQLGGARKLIVVAAGAMPVPPVYRQVKTTLAKRPPVALPWEAIGAKIVKDYLATDDYPQFAAGPGF